MAFPFRSRPSGVAVIIVLLCCVLSPFLMLYMYSGTELDPSYDSAGISAGILRKALDVDEDEKSAQGMYSALKSQIDELQRIKVSVRNEMRELEKKRNSIIQETETYKASYFKLESNLQKGRKELNELQTDLANAGHKLYAATPPPEVRHTDPPPIFILSEAKSNLPQEGIATQKGYDAPRTHRLSNCESDISSCVDFSICPLSSNIKFYLYPIESYVPSASLKLKYPELLSSFVDHLRDTNSLADNAADACLFLVILGPFEEMSLSEEQPVEFRDDIIYTLKYWGHDGKNHVLINLQDLKDTRNFLDEFDPMKAIVVQSQLTSYYRQHYDVIVPLVGNVLMPSLLWIQLPPILPAQRKYLLYFSGEVQESDSLVGHILQILSQHVTEPVNIHLKCAIEAKKKWKYPEIPLCDTEDERLNLLRQSTFAVVPVTGSTGLLRLNEALMSGAIPVIIGASPLPFGSVIDWHRAAIIVPVSRLREIHFIIRSITENRILEYRRQGKFLWETYFSSLSKVLINVVAILRARLFHPPPPVEGIQGKSKLYGPDYLITSPTFQHNFSMYDTRYWNSPPGPTLMFPHTPWDPVPISGTAYMKMTNDQLAILPPHVVQAGGITGPFFENYLLGDRPTEYFTVVILTYKREEVVLDAIDRLDGLKFLAKIVVVWNDLDKDPNDLDWPPISAPVEVQLLVALYSQNHYLYYKM